MNPPPNAAPRAPPVTEMTATARSRTAMAKPLGDESNLSPYFLLRFDWHRVCGSDEGAGSGNLMFHFSEVRQHTHHSD